MRRLLPILVPGFAIASLLIFAFGDSGLLAYRRLEQYRQTLGANVEKLKERNAQLAGDLAGLKDDAQLNLVLARHIGLYEPGDNVVKLEGRIVRTRSYEVGDLVRLPRQRATRNTVFKATGIGISGALAVLAFLAGRSSRRKPHEGPRG